jgi:DNA-binding MarR family transcriptional regulator
MAATPTTSDDIRDFIDQLVQVSFEVSAIVTRIGAEHDLSLTLIRMLGILRDRTITMAELADYLGLERSTVTGLVDRAERRGLVSRTASASDGRRVELRLSPHGQGLADGAVETVGDRLAPIVARLPQELYLTLPTLLGELNAARR